MNKAQLVQMSTQTSDIVELVQDEGGTRLGPDIGSSSQQSTTRRNAAKRNKKTGKNKKPRMEDLLEKLEELNNEESESESEFESELESDSDSDSNDDSSDDSSDSDSDDDIDISAELDESDVDAQKVKVQAADLGHRFLQLQMDHQDKEVPITPLIGCCASGNIDLLDEILEEGLFCPKSNLLFLLNICAGYPIQDLAMKMYDAIKEGAAACSGDPDAGYDPCKYCEPKKKKGKGRKRKNKD